MKLSEASIQDIQMELIRRSSFNSFDGEKVAADLLGNKDLWTAVLMDRPGIVHSHIGMLPGHCMIKLRDLDADQWNVDTLLILTEKKHIPRIKELAENWSYDEINVHTREDAGQALGSFGGDDSRALISFWWD